MCAVSSVAVSAGAKSSANRTASPLTIGRPGSCSPRSCAITRSRTSFRSVVRSAITPPAASNMVTNFSVALAVAYSAGRPLRMLLRTALCQPRSLTMPAVAPSTSAACPSAPAARCSRRLATTSTASRKRSYSPSRFSSSISSPAVGRSGRGRTHTASAYATPATTPVPLMVD